MSFKVTYLNKTSVFDEPIQAFKIIGNNKDIIAIKANNRVRELLYIIKEDTNIEGLTLCSRDAMNIYTASLRYIVAMAMYRIDPNINIKFSYSISRCILMESCNKNISLAPYLPKLEEEVRKIVDSNYPFIRQKVSSKEGAKILNKFKGFKDKIDILKYRPENTLHIYWCDDYCNYMYERMVPSTGFVYRYNFIPWENSILIQYPRPDTKGDIPEFQDAPIFRKNLERSKENAKITGCDSVYGINKRIEKDGPVDMISLAEAMHYRQLVQIGDRITKANKQIKIICIAGPSSSGKTTFANRLRVELMSRGYNPVRISLDDYYIENAKASNIDLESIDALDIDLFQKNMNDLIAGKEVLLPSFNFKTQKREFKRSLKLHSKSPIIVEGIHALNSKLSEKLQRDLMYKIFIQPYFQINLDNHNPMSLTDIRLIRRITRDHAFRNTSAAETISMWDGVRRGEFTWIYKTQEEADYAYNSLLLYELPVIKKYAMPLLEEITIDSEYYPVAERLIRMLKYFDDMDDTFVPCNSIIKEFIGGSCYND